MQSADGGGIDDIDGERSDEKKMEEDADDDCDSNLPCFPRPGHANVRARGTQGKNAGRPLAN